MKTDTAVRIGINGFGRIGRCVARQILKIPGLKLVHVNDLGADANNFAYLFNYDSTYGRADDFARAGSDGASLSFGQQEARFTNDMSIDAVDWEKQGVDIVVDATGVSSNVRNARNILNRGSVKKVVVTHAPKEGVDKTLILGVNDKDYNPQTDSIIASSICDANAIAPVLAAISETFGIESCFITTLHPWLSYQNLVDSPIAGQADPKHPWKDYALGRSSVGALIPKDTTAADAILQVMPELKGRIDAFSYRIPTSIVTSADLSIQTHETVSRSKLESCLKNLADTSRFVDFNSDSLVSVDFVKTSASSIIDGRWIKTIGNRAAKIVVWYDNEWAYSARVVDLIRLAAGKAL